jgi:preprotein translocase subunit YajC
MVLGSFVLAAAQSKGGSSGATGLLLTLVLMGGLFYFLLIRPQQRRTRQQRSLIESVEVDDEVMTIGGMYGTVRSVDDDSIMLQVAPGVDIRIVKSAIARKLVYEDEADQGEDQEEETEEEEAGDQS